jgi:predicted LPLAT superfamily acyltransferase
MSHWSTIKEKSTGYWQLVFLLKIYQLLGKTAFKLSLYPVVAVFYIVSKQTRIFSAQYLNRVYKKSENSFPPVTYKSIFKHIFSFADSLSDKVIAWSGNLSIEKLNFKTQATYEEFIELIRKKQGVFIIGSHVGNMEVLRALGSIYSEKNLGRKLQINNIMQLQHTAHFNRLIKKLSPDVSTNLISALDIGVDTVISLKDKLNNGELVITSGDRTATKNQDKTIEVEFLGDTANFPLGSFTLASLLESPVYFMFLMKEEDESYSFYLYKSAVDFKGSRKERKAKIEQVVKEYAGHMENMVLQYPYQWYNFFDFWKK